MKPRDLLAKNIKKYILPKLEARGYVFHEKDRTFIRKDSQFTYEISFVLNKYSWDNYCNFWMIWGVYSDEFAQWKKEFYGTTKPSNVITGANDWNIPGYPKSAVNGVDLHNSIKDIITMWKFVNNFTKIGLPYIEGINNWKSAALAAEKHGILYQITADLYTLAGENEKSVRVLKDGLELIKKYGTSFKQGDSSNTEEAIKLALKKRT